MTRRPHPPARGFTLLESVVVVGVTALALGALANLFFIFNALYGYERVFLAVAGSSSEAMSAFEAAVLPAEEVLASHDFSGTVYESATTTLVLMLPAVDSSGDVIAGAKDYVAFHAEAGVLYRTVLADAGSVRTSGTKRLTSTLSSLSFTYDDSNLSQATSITVDIETQAAFKERVVQNRLHERLYLRNKQPAP